MVESIDHIYYHFAKSLSKCAHLQTFFFLWFALSGWLFQFLIFALWVLPFAAPLLIGAVANNLVIQVNCFVLLPSTICG